MKNCTSVSDEVKKTLLYKERYSQGLGLKNIFLTQGILCSISLEDTHMERNNYRVSYYVHSRRAITTRLQH